jgi:hypothetical protein
LQDLQRRSTIQSTDGRTAVAINREHVCPSEEFDLKLLPTSATQFKLRQQITNAEVHVTMPVVRCEA